MMWNVINNRTRHAFPATIQTIVPGRQPSDAYGMCYWLQQGFSLMKRILHHTGSPDSQCLQGFITFDSGPDS